MKKNDWNIYLLLCNKTNKQQQQQRTERISFGKIIIQFPKYVSSRFPVQNPKSKIK